MKKVTLFPLAAILLVTILQAQHTPRNITLPYGGEKAAAFLNHAETGGNGPVITEMALSNELYITTAAEYLKAQQDPGGGFPWTAGGGIFPNTQGTTARGMLLAYEVTHNPDYLNSAILNGNYLVPVYPSTYSDGDPRFDTHTPLFLEQLSIYTGDPQYADFLQTWFWDKLSSGTYGENNNLDATGFGNLVVTVRTAQGIPQLSPWDLSATVIAAHIAGETAIRDALMAQLLAGLEATTGPSTWDVLGLAGAIWASGVTGIDLDPTTGMHAAANSTADLVNTLLGWTLAGNPGAWLWRSDVDNTDPTNGDLQTTAFAVMALHAYDPITYKDRIAAGVAFIKSLEQNTGELLAYPGAPSGAVGGVEAHAEALTAICTVAPSETFVDDDWAGSSLGAVVGGDKIFGYNGFSTVEGGIDNVANSTVHLMAGTYPVTALHITKPVTIEGEDPNTVSIEPGAGNVGYYIDADDVTLMNMTIQGASQAVRFEMPGDTIRNTAFNGVRFLNNSSRGIEIHNLTTVSNLQVINCFFDNPNVGIRLASSGVGLDITITGSTFQNHQLGFYEANDFSTGFVDGLHVTGCTFRNNSFAGVYGEEIRNALIEDNFFENNAWGFYLFKAYTTAGVPAGNITVRNNQFLNSQTAAIEIWAGGFVGSQLAFLGLPVTIENNTIDVDVGNLQGNWSQIDIRLKSGFTHAPVNITGNEVNLTGSFTGAATAAHAVKLRGSLTNVSITHNTLNGGGVGDAGGVPPTSGIYFVTNDGFWGTGQSGDLITITENSISGFQVGVGLFDNIAGDFGSLPAGVTVNLNHNCLFDNGIAGVKNGPLASATVDATANWWGSATGPTHPGNPGGTGDVIEGNVTFVPFSTVPLAACPEPDNTVLLATNSIKLRHDTEVFSGNVIVNNDAGANPTLEPGFELYLGDAVTTSATTEVKANRIFLNKRVVVQGNVYYNVLDNSLGGVVNGTLNTPLSLPVVAALPAFHTGTPGTADVNVPAHATQTLAAGDYRDIVVGDSAVLTMTGGVYNIRNLTLGKRAEIRFDDAGEIRISERLNADFRSRISASAGASISSRDIILYVAGTNGGGGGVNDTPRAANFEKGALLFANLYAPNGTVKLGQKAKLVGAIIARDIDCAKRVKIHLESAWMQHEFVSGLPKLSGTTPQVPGDVGREQLATAYTLEPNFPNPFNPSTYIRFLLPRPSEVQLRIYNVRGQLIRTLIAERYPEGSHTVIWDGRDDARQPVASGVYFYSLIARDLANPGKTFRQTRRMMLVR